jgi:serine/threonine-protein kinase SRPK3
MSEISNQSDDLSSLDSDLENEISESSDDIIDQTDNLKLSGKTLRHYNIVIELGRGAYSIVWLCYNILDTKFYAIKVQNPKEYTDGLSEIKFVQKLPKNPNIFNNLVEYFIHLDNSNKYLCSVWLLHCSNIDGVLRKGYYSDGFTLDTVKKIMQQLIEGVKILHKNLKVFHGDIKTDNILIKGFNKRDLYIINKYKESYNIKNDRNEEHINITNEIIDYLSNNDLDKYDLDDKYINDMKISLADFGTHCDEDSSYENEFGTRYYQAPEIILMGKCSYPVDIWSLGCTFYELLSGNLLFDPDKSTTYCRNWHHLSLINDTCGRFSSNIIRKTKKYKNYFDNNFKLIDYKKTDDRLLIKINKLDLIDKHKKEIYNILKSMLEIDQTKRITIDKLSKLTFFNLY